MKKLTKCCFFALLSVLPLLKSCDALLDVGSERYIYEEDARLKSLQDTIYSSLGLLYQMQRLGDRFVLLGELRGDLMEVTEEASADIKEIYHFEMAKDNPYVEMNTYYSVINLCNYVIEYADTAYVQKNRKPYMSLLVTAKCIRTWTYMQMALNYGEVYYSTKPILSVKDLSMDPALLLGRDAVFDRLLDDLKTIQDSEYEPYELDIVPVRILQGDLYLWRGNYEQAAICYARWILDNYAVMSGDYSVQWGDMAQWSIRSTWANALGGYETLAALSSSPRYGNVTTIDSLCEKRHVQATEQAVGIWMGEQYYQDAKTIRMGDLRLTESVNVYSLMSALDNADDIPDQYLNRQIHKYRTAYSLLTAEDNKFLLLYRIPMVYLRLAEAVNRLGYPQTAFEVLKNGWNRQTLRTPAVQAEIYAHDTTMTMPYYLQIFDFYDAYFTNNTGIRTRGCGNINETETFAIPDSMHLVGLGYCQSDFSVTHADSVLYVEDQLMTESVLEFAFEGHRFHDLMRVALRRNDPAYLAGKVAAKYEGSRAASIKQKLMNESNWYLPQ